MTIPALDYYNEGIAHIHFMGGITHMPEVMTISDVADYYAVPFAWLVRLRSAGALPGSCFGGVLQWRCHRQTVYEWMKEHADEPSARMARSQRGDPPYPPATHLGAGGGRRHTVTHPSA
jgi:hypothetical protein